MPLTPPPPRHLLLTGNLLDRHETELNPMTSVHKGELRVILFPICGWVLLFLCILTQLTRIQFRLNVKKLPREGHWQPEEINDAFWHLSKLAKMKNKSSISVQCMQCVFSSSSFGEFEVCFAQAVRYLQEKIIPSLNHCGYRCHVSCIHIRFLS